MLQRTAQVHAGSTWTAVDIGVTAAFQVTEIRPYVERVYGSAFKTKLCMVQRLGLGVQGVESRVQGSGSRV